MKQILLLGAALCGLSSGLQAQSLVPDRTEGKVIVADPDTMAAAPDVAPRASGYVNHDRPQRIGPSGSTIYGYINYRDTDDFIPGLYEINTLGETTQVWPYQFADQYANLRGLWFRDGKLCGYAVVSVGGDELVAMVAYQEIDLLSGTVTKSAVLDTDTDMMPYMMSCAYNPADDYIYGFGKTGTPESDKIAFKRAKASDPAEVEVVCMLAFPGDRCPSFCYSPVDKCFYGVTIDGRFVKMNTQGEATVLFTVPDEKLATTISALTFSPNDGCLLWNPAVYGMNSSLYAVYPDEKRVELLKTFEIDQQFTSFVTNDVVLDIAAPARPVINSVEFEGHSLSGSLSFTMPSELYDGTPVSTPMEWELKSNGSVRKSGTATPGETVSLPLADIPAGDYFWQISASLDGHKGYPAVAHRYVGHDTPVAPADVMLTTDRISWTASSGGVHNGYVDLDNIKYEVWLNDTKLGETDATDYEYSLAPDDPMAAYRARVYASADGMTSDAAVSDKLVMGRPFDLPYTVVPTADQAEIIVTENRDGSPEYGEWRFVEDWGGVSCFASGWSYEQPDDWLILPAVNFPDNSVAYKVTVEAARGSNIGSREYFEIWVGTEPNAASMTIPVLAKTRPRSRNWEDYSNVFAVPRAGNYYVAIHGCSDPDMKDLIVRNIRIEATDEPTAVPASVSGLVVSATSDADLTATVSFTLPERYINGEEIPAGTEIKAVASCADTVELAGTPGTELTATVSTNQGDNVIAVYCVAGGIEGQTAEVMTFTGQDLLSYVEDYEAHISEDNMSAHPTWKAPAESLNGGYFSTTGVKYWIAEILSDGSVAEGTTPVLAGTDVYEYDYTLPAGAPQEYRRLAVIPENAAGLSPARWYIGFAMGTPYSIPMVEKWENIAATYAPLRVAAGNEYSGAKWAFGQPELVDPSFAHTSNRYTLVGYTEENSARLRITLPKFATSGGELSIRATFDFFTGDRGARDITILASSWGDDPEVIGHIPAGEGWSLCDVSLPQKFLGRPWVDLAVDGYLDSPDHYLLLSNYTIADTSGIADTVIDKTAITFDGHLLSGEGLDLTVTDTTGIILLEGHDALDLSSLPAGIYIATGRSGDATRSLKLRLR